MKLTLISSGANLLRGRAAPARRSEEAAGFDVMEDRCKGSEDPARGMKIAVIGRFRASHEVFRVHRRTLFALRALLWKLFDRNVEGDGVDDAEALELDPDAVDTRAG